MPIGLKRSVVELADHDPLWKTISDKTIRRLQRVFGSVAKDIQHVGSTAIAHIKAKPIIDIAICVDNLDQVEELMPTLMREGWSKSVHHAVEGDILLVDGGEQAHRRTHHVHIVETGSIQWKNYICFRDYLNANISVAKEYEAIKVELASKHPDDRNAYTEGKDETVECILRAARIWDDFGRQFSTITYINKGWSKDKKYCVTKTNGDKYLLRISPPRRYEGRKQLFSILQQVASLDIPMCRPVAFGTCTDGVYLLQTWVGGKDLEEVLPVLTETDRYNLGLEAGRILRAIHNIPAPKTQEDWAIRFNRKASSKIQQYLECGLHFDGAEKLIAYVENNRHLLQNRPQCFQHGDYHIGNMMLENGQLTIIDFDRYDFGDPWEEFNRIVWSAQASPHFATGTIHGYFSGHPPTEFWQLLALYIASNTLSSIPWAISFGQGEDGTMMKLARDVLCWYDGMKTAVPKWYLADLV